MILLDLTDHEKLLFSKTLARIAEGMNVSQQEKDVAIKVARQLFIEPLQMSKQ